MGLSHPHGSSLSVSENPKTVDRFYLDGGQLDSSTLSRTANRPFQFRPINEHVAVMAINRDLTRVTNRCLTEWMSRCLSPLHSVEIDLVPDEIYGPRTTTARRVLAQFSRSAEFRFALATCSIRRIAASYGGFASRTTGIRKRANNL